MRSMRNLFINKYSGRQHCFLSPHSDDLAFSISGFLEYISNFDVDVRFITIFSKSIYTSLDSSLDIKHVTQMRKREDELFIKTINASWDPIWLDLDDAPLRPGNGNEDPCSPKSLSAYDLVLASRIVEILDEFLEKDSVIFAPLGIGQHIDHRIVRAAALACFEKGRELIYFEDLPYAGEHDIETLQATIFNFSSAAGLEFEQLLFYEEGLVEQKQKAFSCYASQTTEQDILLATKHVTRIARCLVPAERFWLVKGASKKVGLC